jgi:ribosomal protein S18 acetylase RimI-like enzyme
MDVRLAGPEDLEELTDLMKQVYHSFGEMPPPEGQLTDFLGSVLAEGKRLQFVVAVDEGEIVGCLSLAFCPTTLRLASFAYLDDFHVRQHARGRGIGRALLRFARDHARASGAVELKLTASTNDARLARLYREMGFVPSVLPLFVLPLDVPEGGSAA